MSTDTAPAPGLSEIERVVDTFVAPSKTFEDIRTNARWWSWLPPFLIMVVLSIGVGYSVQKQVGFERVYMNSLRSSPTQEDRINQLPPDQKERTIRISAYVTEGTFYGFPVILAIGYAIYALILWAAFNFGLGAQTTFKQVYAVSWYAALPYLITSLLTIIIVWFGGNAESFDSRNPVGTNLAYYLPDLGAGLKALFASLDIVRLWSVALQVIGMAIIAKKSIAQSAVIVVGIFVLVVGISAGVAAAFS
jgi:hypothetical protein